MSRLIFAIISKIFLTLFLVGISACAGAKGKVKVPKEVGREKAMRLFKQGAELLYIDNHKALEKFDAAAHADAAFFEAFYNAGVALEAMGKLEEAVSRYESCLKVEETQGNCLTNLLLAKANANQLNEAEELSKKYLKRYPNQTFAMNSAATLSLVQKNYQDAEKFARLVIERDADNVYALTVMAQVFIAQKKYPAAKFVIKNALELAPSDGSLYLLLGQVNVALSLLHDALDDYEKAVKYQPTEEALQSYGLLLLRRGKPKEALPILQRLSELRPDLASNYLNLGNAYFGNQLFEEAKAAYEKALAVDPKFNDVNFNLGLLFLNLKPKNMEDLERYKAAEKHFNTYLQEKALSPERVKEVQAYLKTAQKKIELLEYEAQAEKEAAEERAKENTPAEENPIEPSNTPQEPQGNLLKD